VFKISTSILFFPTFLDMRFRASSSLSFTELQRPQRPGTLTPTEGARNARALSISLYLSKEHVRRSPSVSCLRRSAHLAVIQSNIHQGRRRCH
jgi:hypothetical protein